MNQKNDSIQWEIRELWGFEERDERIEKLLSDFRENSRNTTVRKVVVNSDSIRVFFQKDAKPTRVAAATEELVNRGFKTFIDGFCSKDGHQVKFILDD